MNFSKMGAGFGAMGAVSGLLSAGVSIVTDPNVTAINASSWDATYTSPPTFDPVGSPKYVVASRQGFDNSGNATTYSENIVITQRVRQAYPSQASLDANRVALSDYIYSTDTIVGVTNNATETSPKPICNWVMSDRITIGNTINLEIVAFHRNGRNLEQIACVEFSATDGTTTVTQKVSASVISTLYEDAVPVIVYKAALDVSTLANPATITCNAKVYPWIGGASAVADSSLSSVAREFSPRTFRRDTSAQRVAYVRTAANGGNDATGVVSTIDATASALPFATVLAAINAMHTAGGMDGATIYIGDSGGTPFVLTSTVATRTQSVSALTITREAGVSRANAQVSFGLAAFRPRFGTAGGWLRLFDLKIVRTGTLLFTGEATSFLTLYFNNVTFDNGSNAAAIISNADASFYSTVFSNLAASVLNAGGREIRAIRGCTLPTPISPTEGFLAVGNISTSFIGWTCGARTETGMIVAFNKCMSMAGSGNSFVEVAVAADANNVAIVQNVAEYISATASGQLRVTADANVGNVSHVIIQHNTFTGFFSNGRSNIFYEDGTTARTSKLMSVKGNIHVQINTKGDVFVTSGARVGNWGYLYGAGCAGEFSQFIDANSGGLGTSFAQAYPGLNASIGTSNSTRNDPLFTSYQGTTSGPTAGAGGGDYTLQAGSPCKLLVKNATLRFDLAGVTRTAITSSGAYQ